MPCICVWNTRSSIQELLSPRWLSYSSAKLSQFCNTYTWRVYFFYQGCKRGEDKDVVRENISYEYPPPWFDVQWKIFPRSRQVCQYEKLLNNLAMIQRVIRERDFLFFSHYVATVWQIPFRNPGRQMDSLLFWCREMVKYIRLEYWSWWIIWPCF